MTENFWDKKKRIYKTKILSKINKHYTTLPIEADIEPTIKCNLKCIMCQRTHWQRIATDMTLDFFKFIIAQIPSLERIKLQGMGEPLMNAEIFKMIKYASDLGIEVSTVTNGILLTEDNGKKLLDSGIHKVFVSVDTLKQETYKEIRGGNFLTTLLTNLKIFADNGKNNKLGVMMLALKNNQSELLSIVKQIIDYGIKTIFIQVDLTEWGKKEWSKNSLINSDEKILKEQLDNIYKLCKNNNVHFEVIENTKLNVRQECIWPKHRLYITCDGYIQPCCKVSDPIVYSLGNIKENSFEKIWNSKEYLNLRANLYNGNIPEFCRMCYVGKSLQ